LIGLSQGVFIFLNK